MSGTFQILNRLEVLSVTQPFPPQAANPLHLVLVGGIISDTNQASCTFLPSWSCCGVPLGAKSTSLAMSDISGRVVEDCHGDFHGSVTGATSSSLLPSSL